MRDVTAPVNVLCIIPHAELADAEEMADAVQESVAGELED